MLNTLVLTSSVSRQAGGLFTSVRRLTQSLDSLPGVKASVLTLRDAWTDADCSQWMPLSIRALDVTGLRQFGYSRQFKAEITASHPQIVHTHGLWMYPSVAAFAWYRKTGCPYLVSPRGMLDAWALKNSRWKKRIAAWCFENSNLRNAACLHALCQSEAQAFRTFGLKNPICIIPNGIDLPSLVEASELKVESLSFDRFAQGKKVLLYLGRLHPKKGLVNLLRAWARVNAERGTRNAEWVLGIAGWDQGGHEAELKTLATELGILWNDVRERPTSNIQHPTSNGASVVFLGPQFGDAKAVCYQNCDAFILPSFSEGLPMVVLEAWAYGKPVLKTPECNLPEGFAANAAIRIEQVGRVTQCAPGVGHSIERGLEDLFRTPHSALRTMGDNGRRLVAEKFTWSKIAGDMKSVYDWVLGGGTKPGCVFLESKSLNRTMP